MTKRIFCVARACVMTLALPIMSCAAAAPPPAPARAVTKPAKAVVAKQTTPPTRKSELARFDENRASTFRIDVTREGRPGGHGTGTVISTEGHLLTAYHVVNDEKAMFTIVMDEAGKSTPTTYPAKVVAFDSDDDIAVIKIERRFLVTAVLEDVRNVRVGDSVYNIGYPYMFGVMVGRGYIMKMHYALRRPTKTELEDTMLLNIPDGSGTSGSGVFAESNGRLIGVMRVMFWVQSGNEPPLVVKAITPTDHVIRLLDKNHIPYSLGESP